MAIKERNVIYPPSDASLLFMEQDPKVVALKKYAIFDIVTGKPFDSSHESFGIILYGTYLLEEIGLNLGNYPYEFLPDLGIVSPTLSKEIKDFDSYALLHSIKQYLLGPANELQKAKISRLMYESINYEHSGYNRANYLGAVANLHYLTSKDKEKYDDEGLLLMLENTTQFSNRSSNEIALQSAKRFTHK